MKIPASNHFTPIDLMAHFNANRGQLPDELNIADEAGHYFGQQSFRGIPFALGASGQNNILLLDQEPIEIEVDSFQATYLVFLHVVENRVTNYQDGLADFALDGNELGQVVSDYDLVYADGTTAVVPVLRRFAIQQTEIEWGASPFAAVPAAKPSIFLGHTEAQILGRPVNYLYGTGEVRNRSARDSIVTAPPLPSDKLWLYALPNPHPDRPIQKIVLTPKTERSVIYGIARTQVEEHPLRLQVRRKARLTLPDGVQLNAIDELDGLEIDLGLVISARAVLDYDESTWNNEEPNPQPVSSSNEVIVEYAAHPQAKLYVATGEDSHVVYDLATLAETGIAEVAPAHRPVKIRVVEKDSGQPVSARLHLHGADGEYLPPKGHHRKVNRYWFEDNYAEFANGHNQYSYIPGECIADLPLGTVYIEIRRGYEVKPLRTSFNVTAETDEITFELERVLRWREQGWVTADTHVHFLSPHTALLEGEAEGVNVVNLLASQWGEMFSNVGDYDGKSTLGATDFGGTGEFLVRVGTENRMQVLGHISLLGYSGSMIVPLCTAGPSEAAIGDPLEVTMADWAQQCIDQGGLVVMPHGPNPQCERAADIVLGLIHAVEMMTFNPCDNQINPYGIADWYRYLNLGYHIPVVGGSDKMAAASQLGGVRTYTQLGDQPFTYENWMRATQGGNTFVTVGPLAQITVEGLMPGDRLDLPGTGGTVNVTWKVESVSLPIDQVEVIVGGLVADQVDTSKTLSIEGSAELKISESTWVALRVRGSYRGIHGEIAAHTSAVQVIVDNQPTFSSKDAFTVLEQIEGAIAYVDTLAPRPEAKRYKQLRATLEAAHNRLHQRMHQQGVYHQHNHLHDHEQHHEH
jgi:hypothetical protein